jgi:nucleoside-diphosphate-sugar epimerase
MSEPYSPRRLALTGATGALGFAFLRDFFSRRPESRATLLVRRSSASFTAAPFQDWLREHAARVTLIDGDIRELGRTQLDALVRTEGGLWHFAALTTLTANDEEVAAEIQEVNVEGTRRLIDACRLSGKRHPFFHVSTAYVLGQREGLVRENENNLGQLFRNPYEASKSAAERLVGEAFAKGVPGAIFRPSVVVDDSGATGGFKIVDACAFAVALAVKRGEPFIFRLPPHAGINMVHSNWVIAALLDLARMPSGPGRTYHLTAPQPTLFRDIGAVLMKLVPGLKVRFEPDLTRSELPSAGDKSRQAMLDLKPFVELRLRAELDRVTRREAVRAAVSLRGASAAE